MRTSPKKGPSSCSPLAAFPEICWSPRLEEFPLQSDPTRGALPLLSDVYRYNIETDESERITYKAPRAQACFSPNGKHIVYIQIENAITHLRWMDLETKRTKALLHSQKLRALTRHCLNANPVAFVRKDKDGVSSLNRLDLRDLASGPSPLAGVSDVLQPSKTRLEPDLLLGANGNLQHLLRQTALQNCEATHQLRTGAWVRAWRRRIETSTLLRAPVSGLNCAALPTLATPDLPKWNPRCPASFTPLKQGSLLLTEADLDLEDSSFWGVEYLRPRYWIPSSLASRAEPCFKGSTAGQDPLAINSYFLDASYDTVTKKLSLMGRRT